MKIILHMGMPKTGTTSLQGAFFKSRDKLLAHGVLYPDGGAARENHKLLTVLFRPEDRVKRDVKFLYDFDSGQMRRNARKMWESIKRDVQRDKPKILLLSSESFSRSPVSEDYIAFAKLLSELSSDITPVLYFREPAAHYASSVQQNVKQGEALFPLDGSSLSRDVPLIETAFGKPIAACVADRDQLTGGDIVVDFLSRFIAPDAGKIEVATARLNASMSAEELAILDRFRRQRYPDHVGTAPDVFSLRNILAKLARAAGPSGNARLKAEVAQAVRRATLDVLWLRDRYGLVFTGVDYGAIDGAGFDIDPKRTTIEDLFEVDADRRDALEAAAMTEALGAWRQAARIPHITRVVGGAGGGLFSRRRRSE